MRQIHYAMHQMHCISHQMHWYAVMEEIKASKRKPCLTLSSLSFVNSNSSNEIIAKVEILEHDQWNVESLYAV